MKLQIKEIIKYAWNTLWVNSAAWAGVMGLLIVINVTQAFFGLQGGEVVDVTPTDWAQYESGEINAEDLEVISTTYAVTEMLGGETVDGLVEYEVSEATGSILVDIIATILSFILGVGIVATSIAHVRKQKNNIFEAIQSKNWKVYLKYFGGSIVVGVLVLLGMILLIVPGIIIALVLAFALYLIIDKNVGVFESLSESNKMTSGYKGKIFLIVLVTIVINILGALALVIGLLVTIPLTYLIWARVYDLLLQNMNGTATVDEAEKKEDEVIIEVEEVEEGNTLVGK